MQDDKEIRRMSMEMLESDVLLDVSVDQPRPIPAISCGTESYNGNEYEIPLATFGHFSFIQAPPKTKKVSLLVY